MSINNINKNKYMYNKYIKSKKQVNEVHLFNKV